MGLLFAHRRPGVSLIAGYFRPSLNLLLLAVLGCLLTIYLLVFRPLLQSGYEAYVLLIEWLAVGILAAVMALRFYLYFRRRSAAPVMGEWTVLVQRISFEEGDLGKATSAIRDFIDQGRKEGLVVLLASTLFVNHVPQERIAQILERIIDYRRPSFALLFRWTYGDMERKSREDRARMVSSALVEMAEAVGADHLNKGTQVDRGPRVQEA